MGQKTKFLYQNSTSLILFGLALSLRISYVARANWLAGDSYDYLNIAKNLAYYFSFGFGKTESAIRLTSSRPPLYPILISLFWWDGPPIKVILFLQAVLGAITVLLVYHLAKRTFDKRVALIAAILVLLEPFTIHYTASIMTETLFTFLVILGLWLLDLKKHIPAGIVFGLATLTRPTAAPFLFLLAGISLFPIWSAYRRAFLTVFVSALMTVSIWTIRNAVVFNEFIPISSTGYGYNLLTGTLNVPMIADEGWEIVKADPAIQQRRQNIKNGWSESESDRELFREALRRIVSDPVAWLKARAKQYTRLYIDSAPYILGRNNIRLEDAIQDGHWFFIIFKLLLVSRTFIALGLSIVAIVLLRNRFAEISHLILFPVYLMLVHLPLWTENRYLLPIAPFLCILSAYSLVRIFERVKKRIYS